jgi:hypothetical protein
MNIIKFLEQCLYLEEHTSSTPRELAEIQFKRKIIEHHNKWPVLIEEKPQFIPNGPVHPGDISSDYSFTMMQRYMWVVEEDYRKMFGTEPPTAPIIKEMANLYSDYPGFNPEWKI